MAKYKRIEVLAAYTIEDVEESNCVVVMEYDTVKEAKDRARYYLTDDFMRSGELPRPLGYARVVADGECIADYFRD